MKTVLATLNAKYIHMSLALRYLKAYSEREFDIELAEYTIKDPALHVVTDLFQRAPDVIGFSCYIWNIEETIPILRMLKKIRPELRIVLGGPEVSYDTEYWMERIPEVDYIVRGEGEETFHHLLSVLSAMYDPTAAESQQNASTAFYLVSGLVLRKPDGSVIVNPARPKLTLNQIPSPHRFTTDIPQLANRVVYFETSRGCPFSCQFCLSSIEVGVRYYDIERTKSDLLYLIQSGARLIKFVDRTFNIRREYALEIFQFLIEHHSGSCVFQFEITADIMRPEVIAYLSEHAPPGVFRFEIGVQSTNDATNEIIQRRQNFAKLSRTVTMIRESGKIAQHLDLIAGLPEEDYHSFRNTFNDVFALGPEELQLGFLKMLRGTGVRARAGEHGYVYMDHAPYEILGNNVLSFADIVRIKQAEDVLEKYWNAHRMDMTVNYLIMHVFPSAFDFFQTFGSYWESRGWERIGHQLEDLFTRLREFLHACVAQGSQPAGDFPIMEARHLPIIEGLMKFDYFRQHKHRPRKIWWERSFTAEEHAKWMQVLLTDTHNELHRSMPVQQMRWTEREFHKQVMIERIDFDLNVYLAQGTIIHHDPHMLVAWYSTDTQDHPTPLLVSLPLRSMNGS
jgi:anaerobic magnesium-protoporphyrin IX monomethyl ester cyclase